MNTQTEKKPIERLLSLYDNVSHCARELGLKRQHIQLWIRQGYIPFKRGEFIEDKTNGVIKAADIYTAAARDCK